MLGANYMEANGASSRRDFANKIYICKKEAQETKHWFRMLSKTLDREKMLSVSFVCYGVSVKN